MSRYSQVARVLESLSVLAGGQHRVFEPTTPDRLRAARSCYDHMAGNLAVALHDRLAARRWIRLTRDRSGRAYALTDAGTRALRELGLNVEEPLAMRRRFAYPCLDWSERRPHLGGALGAAMLNLALKRRWVERELDSRALAITRVGRREMLARFKIDLP